MDIILSVIEFFCFVPNRFLPTVKCRKGDIQSIIRKIKSVDGGNISWIQNGVDLGIRSG